MDSQEKRYELPEAFSDYLLELWLRYHHEEAIKITKTIRQGDEIRPAYTRTRDRAAGE